MVTNEWLLDENIYKVMILFLKTFPFISLLLINNIIKIILIQLLMY